MYQHDFKSVKESVIHCASMTKDLAYSDRSIIYRTPTATVTATAFGIHRPMGKNTDLTSTCQKTTMGLRKIIPGKDNLMEPDISIIEDLVKEPSSRTCLESYNLGRYFVCLIN